jgi:hypothetical protein
MPTPSYSVRSQGRKAYERASGFVEDKTTPLPESHFKKHGYPKPDDAQSPDPCSSTEGAAAQSQFMLPEQQCAAGGHSSSWTGSVWRFALAALVSISLALNQVLVMMIPRKRDADKDASAAAVPEVLLLVDIFAACFTIIPAGDLCRTWAADRTIMLRMTSKRFKELVDKLRPPVVVRWSLSFLEDERNGTAAEKLKLVFRQLAALSARSRITKLELFFDAVHTRPCTIKGQDAKRLAGVLAQCPALAHLNLIEQWI